MSNQVRKRLLGGLFLMLLSPVLTLVQVLRRRQSKTYLKWMLIFFATFYASTFRIEGIGDGTVHWLNVYAYYVDLSFPRFLSDLEDILLFRINIYVNDDVYIHVLSYFVGGVLGAPGMFFTFVGFIYGYFFASVMVKVFDKFPSPRRHFGFFVLAVYFIAILNLQSMNTVRTWTGFWILLYATMQYHDTRKLKYLLLLFIPPLIHVGYFLMAIPVWVAIFVPLKRTWIIALYCFSFVGSIVSPRVALQNINQYEVGQQKIMAYQVEEKTSIDQRLESNRENRWYLAYQESGILGWVMVAITLVFIINGDYMFQMNRRESLLFSAGMLTKALSNNSWFLFAVTNRSATISALFILAGLLLYWQRRYFLRRPIQMQAYLKPIFMMSILTILPVFFYFIANNLEYLSAYMLAFPFVAWISETLNITMRELIGNLMGLG